MSKLSVNQLYLNGANFNVADDCFRIVMKTGVLAAGSVGANDVLFAMRPITTSVGVPTVAFVERIRLQYTCITAFGTPVTAGRSLAISGGNDIAAAGGTQLVKGINKGRHGTTDMFGSALGGETWIANTGPLTGATVKADALLAEMSLAGFGHAGDSKDMTFNFTGDQTAPVGISRVETTRADNTDLVIYAPQAFDATGTFELIVEVDVNQLP